MIRDIPRYWTGWGISDISLTVSASAIELRLDRGANRGVWGDASRVPPASSSHDQGAAEGRHGPAEVHRDLGVLHLAAAARGVVVGVDALGGLRAVVVHGPPELADVLDHHRRSVPVPLAKVATPAL